MDKLKVNFWHIMLRDFMNKKNAIELAKKISSVYVQDVTRFTESENDFKSFAFAIRHWRIRHHQ